MRVCERHGTPGNDVVVVHDEVRCPICVAFERMETLKVALKERLKSLGHDSWSSLMASLATPQNQEEE